MHLAIGSHYLREMLHALAHKDVQSIFSLAGRDALLLAKSRKALTVLNGSGIAYLIESLFSFGTPYEMRQMLRAELNIYLQ